MKGNSRKLTLTLPGLVLMMMFLTNCANGPPVLTCSKANPSGKFVRQVAHEYKNDIHGDATKEVVKDWIIQNKP